MFKDANFQTLVLFLIIGVIIGLVILVIVVDAPLPDNTSMVEVTAEITPEVTTAE